MQDAIIAVHSNLNPHYLSVAPDFACWKAQVYSEQLEHIELVEVCLGLIVGYQPVLPKVSFTKLIVREKIFSHCFWVRWKANLLG